MVLDRTEQGRYTAGFPEEVMASASKQTSTIRRRKQASNGRSRKKTLEKKGTTKSELELFGNVLK